MDKKILLLLFCLPLFVFSQVSDKYKSDLAAFYRAENLFEKEQYSAARHEYRVFLDNFTGQKSDPFYIKALYYEGLSALELFNNDAITLLEHFNREYPESIYRNDIFLRIGRYYYQKKDYKKALDYLAKLDRTKVEDPDLEEFYFKLAYSNFQEEKLPEAKAAFYEVKDSEGQYGPAALYYYSHICYQDSSYQQALEGFEKLQKNERFAKIVPFYIAQIYYLQGNYKQVTQFSNNDLDSLKPNEKVQMNHIIGDSYFKLGKYDEAVPYLEYYNNNANSTRDDDFSLALAYSRSENCTKAVKYFDRVARIKDTLGQIALYNAGECYSNMNELTYARTAFEAASNIDKDKSLQEDALFRYAVLSYKLDLNAYDEAREAFERYLEKYPDSKRKATVYEYLVNVYTSTKNYSAALASLEKIPQKDVKLKSAYQLIAFNRGVELYTNSDFVNAIEAFKLVDKYPMNPETSAKAKFWEADCNYMLKKPDAALKGYDDFLKMPGNSNSGLRAEAYYNKGYVLLAKTNEIKDEDKKRQSSDQTRLAFEEYIKSAKASDKKKKADAYMRVADEYYRMRNDEQAVVNYRNAFDLKSGNEDQALYFLARSSGYAGKKDEKIKTLLEIVNNYPNSKYVQRSLFDVAFTYLSNGNFDKSKRYFEAIITDYPNSAMVKDAHHFLGVIAQKQGDFNLAEKQYRKVLLEFTVSDTICKREVYALADLYRVSMKDISKLENLSKEFSCADSLGNEVEVEYYMAGYSFYEEGKFAEALVPFETYLTKYGNGKYRRDVLNYKADCLYRTGKEDEAMPMMIEILKGKDDDFTEYFAQRIAKSLYNKEDYEGALPYYLRVEKVGSNPELLQNSRIGIMRSHFLMETYPDAAEYAKKVLNNNVTGEIRLEAEYIRGVALANTKNFMDAIPNLEYVVKNTNKSMAAEAKYYIAYAHYRKPDLTKAETTIRELLKMKPQYNFWIAKALILQSRIQMEKGDLFQAEQTINSVIENYKVDDDGILDEANELYDEIITKKSQPKTVKAQDENTVIEIEDKGGKK